MLGVPARGRRAVTEDGDAQEADAGGDAVAIEPELIQVLVRGLVEVHCDAGDDVVEAVARKIEQRVHAREVFAQLGKGGDVANSDLEAICRLLSLWLRANGTLKVALKQLEGIGSTLTVPTKDGRIMSLGDGLAQAFIIGEEFLNGAPSVLVLGDNIFFGHGLSEALNRADQSSSGATIFGYEVRDPGRYGIVEFDADGQVLSVEEKPEHPKSNYCITGLYFYDGDASALARQVKPSARGELEITALNELYLRRGDLNVELLGRGYAWLDTGTFDSLLQAGEFVRTLEERQGHRIGCLEEIALRAGWIDADTVAAAGALSSKNPYCQYLVQLAERARKS